MYKFEIEISELQAKILMELQPDSGYCYGYGWLSHLGDKKTLQKEIKTLRAVGLVEYYRGLMDDDGMVAGSGFCRSSEGNKFIEKYQL